ncbi:MAG: hypothetical protein R3281_09260 [Balneolaceae bacterium]|nr:hypothetical protein [Balneolaceae bacterium]
MKPNLTVIILLTIAAISSSNCDRSGSISPPDSPAGTITHLPYLTTDGSELLHMSWVETDTTAGTHRLLAARYDPMGWSSPQKLADGNSWFVNWADYPSILTTEGRLRAAHWLQKIPGNAYSYNIRMLLAARDTAPEAVITPHFDSTATEHGFVSMIPHPDSSNIMAVWLDGRRTADRAENEYTDLAKAMTLRSALIRPNGRVSGRSLIDSTVCDCCQTSLVMTENGAVAAYRNRTKQEIRDIYVSKFAGGRWTRPIPVHPDNWQIGGCPVNGPVIQASESTIAVAWFTGAGDQYRVKAAFSNIDTLSFSEPVTIDDGTPIGRLDAVFITPELLAVSWMEKVQNTAHLNVRTVDIQTGKTGRITTIGELSPDRQSGFPQMEVTDNTLYFAWTDVGSHSDRQLALATLPVARLLE